MKKRAVLYLRKSTAQQETSIPDQRRVLHEKFSSKYRVIGEYVDAGISGDDTARRKDFQRMLKDAMRGVFDVILCWDQDRFGRFDSIEAGFWIKPLRDAGIRLVTATHGEIDWNDFSGRMIYSIVQEGKHAYLRDLSRNVLRGQLARAQEGYWPNGPAPYGYRISETKPKKLLLGSPEQLAVVRRIFNEYLEGRSLRRIADRLNDDGVPVKRGSRGWSGDRVREILRHRVYCGDLVWNQQSYGRYSGIQGGAIVPVGDMTDESSSVTVEGAFPAIIDRTTYERAQQQLARMRIQTAPIRGGGESLLNKLIYCSECGSMMYGSSRRGSKRFYICSLARRYRQCRSRKVWQDPIVGILREKLIELVLLPENLDRAVAEFCRLQETGPAVCLKELDGRIRAAERRLVEVEADMVSVVSDHLRELRRQRDKAASQPVRARQLDRDQIVAMFAGLRERLDSAEPEVLRMAFQESIRRIDVQFDGDSVDRISVQLVGSFEKLPTSPIVVPGSIYREACCGKPPAPRSSVPSYRSRGI